jgi:hypothetical protein
VSFWQPPGFHNGGIATITVRNFYSEMHIDSRMIGVADLIMLVAGTRTTDSRDQK